MKKTATASPVPPAGGENWAEFTKKCLAAAIANLSLGESRPDPDVPYVVIPKNTAAAAAAASPPCYHGSTERALTENSVYNKALVKFMNIISEYSIGGPEVELRLIHQFSNEHLLLVHDQNFAQFIFAFCTKRILEQDLTTNRYTHNIITQILRFAIRIRYDFIPVARANGERDRILRVGSETYHQFMKYERDVHTERGIIKCLARETKAYGCKCMSEDKQNAASMTKVAICNGCFQTFPKMKLLECPCHEVTYCSTTCQRNVWPQHKKLCSAYAAKNSK